jgi:rfaE bifunctional protein nucleotidyltransferase chain/domain
VKLENSKLLCLEDARLRRQRWREAGKKVVMTNGVFDLLHTGHVYSLKSARALGDILIVALNSDASVRAIKGPTRPVQGEVERAYALSAMECVDAIVIFSEARLTKEISQLRPDVYCKSGDYTLEKLNPDERAALEAADTAISFVPFLPGFSTTQLIAKIKAAGEI